MIKKNLKPVSTLSALKERHLEPLQSVGITAPAIKLLTAISQNWVEGAEVAPAVFRRDHRQHSELLRRLEDRRFISSNGNIAYEPQFNAFCALLVARKRIAVSLFNEMKVIVARALTLLDQTPLQTQFRFDDFVIPMQTSALTLPACRLLASSSLGVHLYTVEGIQLIQFSEDTFKGERLLNFVSEYLEMITRSSVVSSGDAQPNERSSNTFSINNLLLVEEAHKHASRAMSQHAATPDTAISSAKSALEATLKYIAHTEGIEVSAAIKLPELFKLCKPVCGLGSTASHKMGRSIASLCTEIAEARNALGDSHGKAPDAPTPTRSEARFIVGVALQLSDCLLERYEAHRMISRDANSIEELKLE